VGKKALGSVRVTRSLFHETVLVQRDGPARDDGASRKPAARRDEDRRVPSATTARHMRCRPAFERPARTYCLLASVGQANALTLSPLCSALVPLLLVSAAVRGGVGLSFSNIRPARADDRHLVRLLTIDLGQAPLPALCRYPVAMLNKNWDTATRQAAGCTSAFAFSQAPQPEGFKR
jgi:hypothetical protein